MTENLTNKNLKIHCIGDSLSMPRSNNYFEDTWFCKLQNYFPNYQFSSFFKRAISTQVLISEGGDNIEDPKGADCLEFYSPDVVIIQLGIVDCAPRLLKNSSLLKKIIDNLPNKLKDISYSIIKKIKKRSIKNVDISPSQFSANLETYLQRCIKVNVKKVIFIKICTPDERMKNKNPEIIDAIILYNNLIDNLDSKYEIVNTLNPLNSNIYADIYVDGYHPNPNGNNLVFTQLKKVIELL